MTELANLSALTNEIAEKSELLGQHRAYKKVIEIVRDEALALQTDVDRYVLLGDTSACAAALARAEALERIVEQVTKLSDAVSNDINKEFPSAS